MTGPRRKWPRRVGIALGVVAAVWAALMVPDSGGLEPTGAGLRPFAWDRDELWTTLERRFAEARARGCHGAAADGEIDGAIRTIETKAAAAETAPGLSWQMPALNEAEAAIFETGPVIAACPARANEWIAAVDRIRRAVRERSRRWHGPAGRERAYRLIYGGRAAIEEVLLQMPRERVAAITPGVDEPSVTPSAVVHGVRVHSGDILISRGGAPTSALIARGNDFPGNFSHIALVHIDESGAGAVIESHIESGVVVSTPEAYLTDKKLRILVLRVRADLPAMRARPTIPHEAARRALRAARARHIPYDFAMDIAHHDAQFCSEVAAAAYEPFGVRLWDGLSTMSSRGVTRWLAAFGVRHFRTEAPSDLEYDPNVTVVAEWRDPEALWQDHVDNAVIDAMLEEAEGGAELEYDAWLLPIARAMKAWSMVKNAFGDAGPVPEGMSATVALRAKWLAAEHARRKTDLLARAAEYQREHGYRPPYWTLLRLARSAP